MNDPYVSAALPVLPSKDERTWALVVHLSAFAGHVFPFAHIIVPLIVWLVKRETSAFIAGVLCFVLIGIPILIGLYVANIIFVIMAAIAANDGQAYRYPCILRLVQ